MTLAARLGSLRFRLAAGMLLVLALAVGAAATLDDIRPRLSPRLAHMLDIEPVQDGLVLGGFAVAVLLLIWVVSAWSLRPLARASAEAAQAGPAHPGARITAHRLPTEMRPLVSAVNGALDRLESAYEAQKRFTADAAHELRTPLSILSLRLQRARLDGTPDWDAVEADVAQMTRLVSQLLDLARKEQAPLADMAPLNLARVAREAAAYMLPLIEAAGRTLVVTLPDSMPVHGHPGHLRDAITNLLENALLHGLGTITLAGQTDATACVLEVGDDGPGVPAALRGAVFERFRKARAATAGTGLGLAIVREVASAHRATVTFADGPTCTARLVLPADRG